MHQLIKLWAFLFAFVGCELELYTTSLKLVHIRGTGFCLIRLAAAVCWRCYKPAFWGSKDVLLNVIRNELLLPSLLATIP
ncbi:hypothetical protein P153DRAFT_206704 [Dothidotthia symphoricarpi CBS 119687]|uniref:Secreted protein n=1 Tax=Dothidotthia symphoricarpi CBS 119687 TaxID=1392245 RepID=A0A6A6AG78_9PLEO|nr:uncharacterized protein P153DRAFT_206704 [Dothidotthia symphoricarpi CBS 119687]KAF2130919.1 hypothetical protein P153DRAFT_206704 [Dothidotthia symphoricarpi CBS 119687]